MTARTAELQSRLLPLMARKLPLQQILKALSDIPQHHVTDSYDALIMQAYDIDLVFSAAA